MTSTPRAAELWLGLALPLLVIVAILTADVIESPKTAYVGVLAVVPMLSAVFARPPMTAVVGVVTWLSAFVFGTVASDGNVAAQKVRLVIIALAGLAAVGASVLRVRRERALAEALQGAAIADQMRIAAETDQLTGMSNRFGLSQRVARADRTIIRTIALIDCDDLKSVNDRLGHLAGDEYLKAIAGRISGSLSKQDYLARWGGDEFIVVQRLGLEDAIPSLHRTSDAVRSTPLAIDGTSIEATVCIGAAQWDPGMSFDAALSAADRALYRAKSRGRNQLDALA